MSEKMRIGELAAHFDLNPKTIRYYETIGVLPRAGRSVARYRTNDEQDRLRLNFIRRARPICFSLNNIRTLLHLLEQKLRMLNQQIAELQTFRATLASLQADWVTVATYEWLTS